MNTFRFYQHFEVRDEQGNVISSVMVDTTTFMKLPILLMADRYPNEDQARVISIERKGLRFRLLAELPWGTQGIEDLLRAGCAFPVKARYQKLGGGRVHLTELMLDSSKGPTNKMSILYEVLKKNELLVKRLGARRREVKALQTALVRKGGNRKVKA